MQVGKIIFIFTEMMLASYTYWHQDWEVVKQDWKGGEKKCLGKNIKNQDIGNWKVPAKREKFAEASIPQDTKNQW